VNDRGSRVPGNSQMKVSGGNQEWGGCCDPRSQSSMGAAVPQMQAGGERAGVGIILALSPDGSLYVHTVCPGGSAEGSLQPGDVLMKIGAEEVYRCAPTGPGVGVLTRQVTRRPAAWSLRIDSHFLWGLPAEHQRHMWPNCCWGLRVRRSKFGCAGRQMRQHRTETR